MDRCILHRNVRIVDNQSAGSKPSMGGGRAVVAMSKGRAGVRVAAPDQPGRGVVRSALGWRARPRHGHGPRSPPAPARTRSEDAIRLPTRRCQSRRIRLLMTLGWHSPPAQVADHDQPDRTDSSHGFHKHYSYPSFAQGLAVSAASSSRVRNDYQARASEEVREWAYLTSSAGASWQRRSLGE
jgi:hypothetical protein